MQEISFWRRYRKVVMTGLVVVLLLVIGGSIIVVREQTQIPQGQICGEITLPAGGQMGYAVAYQGGTTRQVEQCFIQAYRHCQNASMLVTWMETDTGSHETLTVEPQNGQCRLISSSQSYGVGMQSSPQATTYICQGLTLTRDELIVKQCGNGDETIPRAESCGTVYHGNEAGHNMQAEDCFVQDKLQCYPADLFFESDSNTPSTRFDIDGTCKIFQAAEINFNLPKVPCTDMIQQKDGLHFQGCGSISEILVPVNP
jgi:hypothetical protein